MRRAMTAALLASMLAVPAAAQEDAWPQPEELRRDLTDIGWEWRARRLDWFGGPVGSPPGSSVRLNFVEGGVSLSVDLGSASGEEWTMFREVAVRLPVPDAVQVAVARVVETDAEDCRDYDLAGGTLVVNQNATGETTVWIQETDAVLPGTTPRCVPEP